MKDESMYCFMCKNEIKKKEDCDLFLLSVSESQRPIFVPIHKSKCKYKKNDI
jgi:hypothetical protein